MLIFKKPLDLQPQTLDYFITSKYIFINRNKINTYII